VQALLYLYNQILRTGIMPDKFKQALIVVIFKKGSRMECGNYRPISLLSHSYKVFISIIASCMTRDLYTSFPRPKQHIKREEELLNKSLL